MIKKLFIVVLLGVLGAGGYMYYYMKTSSDKDIQEITTDLEKKVSKEEIEKMTTVATDDFRTAVAAVEQSQGLEVSKKLKLWTEQLSSESASIRMQATQELLKLEAEAGEEAHKILEALSTDEKQGTDLRLLVQKSLAQKELKGKEGMQKAAVARMLLKDARPGCRLQALEVLAEEDSDEARALIKKAAESETDEDVKMMAEMLLEE